MHIERIKHAIEVLRPIPDERWTYKEWALAIDLAPDGESAIAACGTVACAGGWLGLNPVCNAQGLYISRNGRPRFNDDGGSDALAAYFEIDEDEAEEIFVDLARVLAERRGCDFDEIIVGPLDVVNELQALIDDEDADA